MVALPDDPEHPDIFQLNNPDKGRYCRVGILCIIFLWWGVIAIAEFVDDNTYSDTHLKEWREIFREGYKRSWSYFNNTLRYFCGVYRGTAAQTVTVSFAKIARPVLDFSKYMYLLTLIPEFWIAFFKFTYIKFWLTERKAKILWKFSKHQTMYQKKKKPHNF